MIGYIIAAIAGYLIGSISVAVLLTRGRFGGDVRKKGSGNAGATNVARVFGMKAGIFTLLGDMLKTAVAGGVGWLAGGENGLAIACAACLAGHCWPVYFQFKGGKGVSVGACIAILLDWRLFLALLVVFALVFVLSRRVSLCSIASAAVYPFIYYFFNRGMSAGLVVCCIVAVIVIFMHRGNIVRLVKGEEPKFVPKSRKG